MQIVCAVCGAVIAEVAVHAAWHQVAVHEVTGDQTPPHDLEA